MGLEEFVIGLSQFAGLESMGLRIQTTWRQLQISEVVIYLEIGGNVEPALLCRADPQRDRTVTMRAE